MLKEETYINLHFSWDKGAFGIHLKNETENTLELYSIET